MKTRRCLLIGAVSLFASLLIATCALGSSLSYASPLAGITPTPSPTPTPTVRPSPTPPQEVTIRVVKLPESPYCVPGGRVTYSILVDNLGPGAATGVELVDELPPQLEFVEASITQGEVTVEGARITALVGVLGAGYSSTLSVTARVRPDTTVGTEIENAVLARSNQTGDATSTTIVQVVGLLPESGRRAAWPAAALTLLILGLLCLALRYAIRMKRTASQPTLEANPLPKREGDTQC